MAYSCGYCGRDYKTPVERGKCEVACETEKRKQEELKKAKNNRYEEVKEIVSKYNLEFDESLCVAKTINMKSDEFSKLVYKHLLDSIATSKISFK